MKCTKLLGMMAVMFGGASLIVSAASVAPTSTVNNISSSVWSPGSTLAVTAAANGSINLGSLTIENNNRAGYSVTVESTNLGKLKLAGVTARAGEVGNALPYTISTAANSVPGTPSGQSPDPMLSSNHSLATNLVLNVNAPLRASQAAKYDFSIAYGAINDLFRGDMVDTITITYADSI